MSIPMLQFLSATESLVIMQMKFKHCGLFRNTIQSSNTDYSKSVMSDMMHDEQGIFLKKMSAEKSHGALIPELHKKQTTKFSSANFQKNVKSLLYRIENTKTRWQTV